MQKQGLNEGKIHSLAVLGTHTQAKPEKNAHILRSPK